MNQNYYVTAKFKIKKDKLEQAKSLIKSLTITTNTQEKGCIEYYYLQNQADEYEFTSFEKWENEAEEAKHWHTEHVQNALQQLPDLLEVMPEIIKWNVLN